MENILPINSSTKKNNFNNFFFLGVQICAILPCIQPNTFEQGSRQLNLHTSVIQSVGCFWFFETTILSLKNDL